MPVAVLDSGISRRHEDLPNPARAVNFSKSPTPNDVYGHGTHVAGTVVARTDNGRTGAARAPARAAPSTMSRSSTIPEPGATRRLPRASAGPPTTAPR